MKMTINFYLDDEEETNINTIYDATSNPFKVGEIIGVSVDEIYPSQLKNFDDVRSANLVKDNEKIRRKLNNKSILLKRELKWMHSFSLLSEGRITIDYYCEIVEE